MNRTVNGATFHGSRFMVHEKGIALLSIAVIVLLLLITIGLSMVSSGIFEGAMAETRRMSQDAYAVAQSGVKDALIKITRNKNFTPTTYYLPSSCTALNVTTACARIIVETTQSACSQTIGTDQFCIISLGTVNAQTRKLEVILSVDPNNGKITTVSTKEL